MSVDAIERFSGDYAFLSNFYTAPIAYEGLVYATVEHAYQAAKSLDAHTRAQIAATRTAGGAKAAGRRVILRSDWDGVRIPIMLELLRTKFRHPDLRSLLLATGKRALVEGNHWGDRFWGVYRGEGQNHLGRLLMQVREEVRAKPSAVLAAVP